jgi:FkbM family methyltransferase
MRKAWGFEIAHFNILIYRMHARLKQSGAEGVLRRRFGMGRGLDWLKRLFGLHLLKTTQVWVQIQSGLSQGLWMQTRLPGEATHWRGEHEPEVQKAILAVVKPGDIVYDIGSHIGTIALGTARLVGSLGRVVAFDGDPENVERLRGNSARNGLDSQLHVLHAAVWSRSAVDGISFRRGTTHKSRGGVNDDGYQPVNGKGEIISVTAITLDDFVASGGPAPQLIKIDVEGGEYEVLRGGPTLFATLRPLVIIEIHHQQAAEQIASWLNEYRYKAQWNIPERKFPICLFAWPTEQDGDAWMRQLANAKKTALSSGAPLMQFHRMSEHSRGSANRLPSHQLQNQK